MSFSCQGGSSPESWYHRRSRAAHVRPAARLSRVLGEQHADRALYCAISGRGVRGWSGS
jgi:hypothetical protein